MIYTIRAPNFLHQLWSMSHQNILDVWKHIHLHSEIGFIFSSQHSYVIGVLRLKNICELFLTLFPYHKEKWKKPSGQVRLGYTMGSYIHDLIIWLYMIKPNDTQPFSYMKVYTAIYLEKMGLVNSMFVPWNSHILLVLELPL